MKVQVIVPTAGIGKRFGKDQPKTLCFLQNKPLFIYALEVFQRVSIIDSLILVVHKQYFDEYRNWVSQFKLDKVKHIVIGGETRTDSVSNGLKLLDEDTDLVAIHDGARPLISPEVIQGAIQQTMIDGAVVVAVPVKPTIKEVDSQGYVVKTLDRKKLWDIQTPQIFKKELLLKAYKTADREIATDDAALLEKMGIKVRIYQGNDRNIKITTPEDMVIAEKLINLREMAD